LNNGTSKSTTNSAPVAHQNPPSSILGGQTTITKKDVKTNESVNKNSVSNHNHVEKKVKMPPADLSKSNTTPKGIPKDTSVTVRSVSSPSSTTALNAKVSSYNNSFKASRNGSTNSMMDLIQKASNQTSSNSSHTSNGLGSVSPNKKSSTLSDLRQFRKDSSANKPQQGGGSTTNTHQRAPIIPSLTPRNLTFGNSKTVGGNAKTGNSNSSSNSSVKTAKSSPPSSFSAVLSKPLPKPGEASSATANNFLNQANQLSALAALSGLGANFSAFTDEQQRALLRNMAAVGMYLPSPMNGLPSVPQQASVTQQLPSNRLKLTVSQAKNNSSGVHSGSPGGVNAGNPLQGMLPPSLASHMSPENQWKMYNAAALASGNAGVGGTNGLNNHHNSKYSSLSKNLNQSIRQIPNPSLLTKQASEQQAQLLQRAIASQVSAAAAVAAANARTSLSQ